MLDRRTFLRRLILGAPALGLAADLDWEKLLWVPKPMIVVPPMPVIFTPKYYEVGVPIYLEEILPLDQQQRLGVAEFVIQDYQRATANMAKWLETPL